MEKKRFNLTAPEDSGTQQTMERFNANVAKVIRQRRFRLGLSQEELAEMAHVARTTISNVEREDRPLSIGGFVRLMDSLGMDIILEPKTQDGKEKE